VPKDKKKSIVIRLLEKVGLVFKVGGRISISAVRRHYGVNEFIIRFISWNEDKEGKL